MSRACLRGLSDNRRSGTSGVSGWRAPDVHDTSMTPNSFPLSKLKSLESCLVENRCRVRHFFDLFFDLY